MFLAIDTPRAEELQGHSSAELHAAEHIDFVDQVADTLVTGFDFVGQKINDKLKTIPQLQNAFSTSWEKGLAIFASSWSLPVALLQALIFWPIAPDAYNGVHDSRWQAVFALSIIIHM